MRDERAILSKISPGTRSPGEALPLFDSEALTPDVFLRFENNAIPVYKGEFWTSKQRQAHSIHEVSYRGCYKPQLPAFFIQRFCRRDDIVFDPFMGRGTTLIEAQLHGCRAIGNDINPLGKILTEPRLCPPTMMEIYKRLANIDLHYAGPINEKLLVFFHLDTLKELYAWRLYFKHRVDDNTYDRTDAWLRMVACNRLTGHSPGFFSVYTLPPNQAASVKSQQRINDRKKQRPEYRDTRKLIMKKSKQLLRDPLPKHFHRADHSLYCLSADEMTSIPSQSVKLVVTSPPFLDNINYLQDNWLRMWFCDIQIPTNNVWQFHNLADWLEKMTTTFVELRRLLTDDGTIAFEVGEMRKGRLRLEEEVARAAVRAGLFPECIMINSQRFTKTSNCWGVTNNTSGTNTNRIVVLRKHP